MSMPKTTEEEAIRRIYIVKPVIRKKGSRGKIEVPNCLVGCKIKIEIISRPENSYEPISKEQLLIQRIDQKINPQKLKV